MDGVGVYKNGSILPCRHKKNVKLSVYSYDGGVVDGDGNFVTESMLHEQPCCVGGAYDAVLKTEHKTVIYIGYLLSEWGNCLTDGLKKLWFLRTDEGRKLIKQGAKVAFITMHNIPLPAHQAELWRLAGFDSSKWMHVTEPKRFDEVIVPENSFVAYPDEKRLFDDRFVGIIKCIRNKAIEEIGENISSIDKIYFTRTKLKHNKDTNEKQIERLFKRLGYTIISPEKLSIKEQIFLWTNATDVATTEGSIAHSSMFMQKNCNLVILKKADYVNGYQQATNRLSCVKAIYINANNSTRVSKQCPWAGPFYLYITPELEHWSGLSIHQLPILLKPSYWWYCIKSVKMFYKIKLSIYVLYKKYII